MTKDYVGLVEIVNDYNLRNACLCLYNDTGNISESSSLFEFEKNENRLKKRLEFIKAEGGIASEVLSGKNTLENLVSCQYKEVMDYVRGFRDLKKFQVDKMLDKQTKLLLRELYDYHYDPNNKIIKTNPLLTENVKKFGEKRSLFNYLRLDNSTFWRNQDQLLSRLKDESAVQVVKARIVDNVVKDVYLDALKK